jgi:hypothetical protein
MKDLSDIQPDAELSRLADTLLDAAISIQKAVDALSDMARTRQSKRDRLPLPKERAPAPREVITRPAAFPEEAPPPPKPVATQQVEVKATTPSTIKTTMVSLPAMPEAIARIPEYNSDTPIIPAEPITPFKRATVKLSRAEQARAYYNSWKKSGYDEDLKRLREFKQKSRKTFFDLGFTIRECETIERSIKELT